jgi:hypothetical protein
VNSLTYYAAIDAWQALALWSWQSCNSLRAPRGPRGKFEAGFVHCDNTAYYQRPLTAMRHQQLLPLVLPLLLVLLLLL